MRAAIVMEVLKNVASSLARGRAPSQILLKSYGYASALALSRVYLRNCTTVGARARVHGKPHIENLGTITIGDDFILNSRYVPSHLVTEPEGRIEIGNCVSINYAAGISSRTLVRIGSRVRIGPYCMIMDSDYHGTRDRSEPINAPICIEDDVWLATRVTILRGSEIGKNSVITAGSVVSGHIPANVVAGGVPARILRRIGADGDRTALDFALEGGGIPAPVATVSMNGIEAPLQASQPMAFSDSDEDRLIREVRNVVAETFDFDRDIDLNWGPGEIPRWTSMGHLQLALAVQEKFGILLTEEDLIQMTSVRQLCEIVRRNSVH